MIETKREWLARRIRRLMVAVCDHHSIHTISPEGKHCGTCGELLVIDYTLYEKVLKPHAQ